MKLNYIRLHQSSMEYWRCVKPWEVIVTDGDFMHCYVPIAPVNGHFATLRSAIAFLIGAAPRVSLFSNRSAIAFDPESDRFKVRHIGGEVLVSSWTGKYIVIRADFRSVSTAEDDGAYLCARTRPAPETSHQWMSRVPLSVRLVLWLAAAPSRFCAPFSKQ